MGSESNVFDMLNPELRRIVKERFKQPTLPQVLAIPPILDGKNILLISETGTGKTESVMMPVLHKLITEHPEPISTLYITPLKSLNRDLLDRMIWWANKLDIEIGVRHGDTTPYQRKQQVAFPPQMLIVTLETLQPILVGKNVRELLKNVKYIILDEVHETVDSKRGVQLAIGLERLRKLCGDFQLIMLSATVGDPEAVAKFFSGGKDVEVLRATTPKQVDIQVITPRAEAGDEKISGEIYTSKETAARIRAIMELIGSSRSSLAFTNTRDFAEILASRIHTIDKKFPVAIHHSSLSRDVRINTEKEFKSEKIKSIICTSSLQLGIDIGSVDLVLQYMSPRTVSQLVQRVGRSGHSLDRVSKGVIIATDEDDAFEASVIARKALAGELEPSRLHTNSLDVMAHQIVGMTLEEWKLEPKKVYETIKSAVPYQSLTFEDFKEVCIQLRNLGLVFLDENIKKKRRGFEYYFSNLSTIPDVKQYRIFNTLEQNVVGVLDEEFVAIHGTPGTSFIVKGEPWRIIDVEEDRILVEPSSDIEAAIPGWEGELMPVPFSVAQEVGQLRGRIETMVKGGDAIAELMKLYPTDRNTAKNMVEIVKKQVKYGIVPTDKIILVEDYENLVVIHTCFGSLVNQTLGRFITAMLTSRLGSVGLHTDPYRIVIEFQQKNLEMLKEVLNTNPEHLQTYLEMSITKSDLFDWKFVHVAKRFGAIARGADLGKTRLKRIIEDYAGTPLYKETLAEIETEKLDIETAVEMMKKMQSGDLKLVFKPGLSPLGRLGVQHKYAELIGPEKPEKELFEIFRQRIMDTKMELVCMHCGKWTQTYAIKDMPDDLWCSKCQARMLAIMRPRMGLDKIARKAIKKSEMTEEEKVAYERMKKTAELFLVYRKKAAIALAGRGVGPETAKRILARLHKDEDGLLREIREAEKKYLETKRYWKI
jgi:ATP-dependent Lhr-like helicase